MGVNQVTKEYSNNVIKFPKEKITNVLDIEHLNKEQADEHITLLKSYIISEVIATIMEAMDNQLTVVGYGIDDETAKDGALIAEALRSLLLKKHNTVHPFQKLAEEMFEITKDDDIILAGNLCIVNPDALKSVGNT